MGEPIDARFATVSAAARNDSAGGAVGVGRDQGGESRAITRRRKRAVESFRSAGEAIGPLTPGMGVFAVTRGQWSMIDALQYVLAQTRPAAISLWTWTIADYEVAAVGGLLECGEITGATLLIDYSLGRRRPPMLDEWRERFGAESIKVVRCHAKIARVWNDEWRLLLRGSMNLNYNPRFEQFDLTEGGEDFDLVSRIEAGVPVLPRDYDHQQVAQATGLGQAFDAELLGMFAGGREWQP